MPNQPEKVEVSAFLTIEPKWRHGTGWSSVDDKGRAILDGATISNLTQKRPTGKTKAGAIITQVRFTIPAALMLPLAPEIVIELTPDNTELIQIEVETPPLLDDPEGEQP